MMDTFEFVIFMHTGVVGTGSWVCVDVLSKSLKFKGKKGRKCDYYSLIFSHIE